jgi:hypothetical protein
MRLSNSARTAAGFRRLHFSREKADPRNGGSVPDAQVVILSHDPGLNGSAAFYFASVGQTTIGHVQHVRSWSAAA